MSRLSKETREKLADLAEKVIEANAYSDRAVEKDDRKAYRKASDALCISRRDLDREIQVESDALRKKL